MAVNVGPETGPEYRINRHGEREYYTDAELLGALEGQKLGAVCKLPLRLPPSVELETGRRLVGLLLRWTFGGAVFWALSHFPNTPDNNAWSVVIGILLSRILCVDPLPAPRGHVDLA